MTGHVSLLIREVKTIALPIRSVDRLPNLQELRGFCRSHYSLP